MKRICVFLLICALILSACGKKTDVSQLMTAELEGTWKVPAGGTITLTDVTAESFNIKIYSGCTTETIRVYKDSVRENESSNSVTIKYKSGTFTFSDWHSSHDDLKGTAEINITFFEDAQEQKIYSENLTLKETYMYNVEITFLVSNQSGYGYRAYVGGVQLLFE